MSNLVYNIGLNMFLVPQVSAKFWN